MNWKRKEIIRLLKTTNEEQILLIHRFIVRYLRRNGGAANE